MSRKSSSGDLEGPQATTLVTGHEEVSRAIISQADQSGREERGDGGHQEETQDDGQVGGEQYTTPGSLSREACYEAHAEEEADESIYPEDTNAGASDPTDVEPRQRQGEHISLQAPFDYIPDVREGKVDVDTVRRLAVPLTQTSASYTPEFKQELVRRFWGDSLAIDLPEWFSEDTRSELPWRDWVRHGFRADVGHEALPDWIDWGFLFDVYQRAMCTLELLLKTYWDPNTDWTYLDVLYVTAQLYRHTRKCCIQLRPSSYPGRNPERIIDEFGRWYTLVTIGSAPLGFSAGVDTLSVPWGNDIPLQACLRHHFGQRARHADNFLTLDKDFTATNLEGLTGISVISTDNLADHLKLVHLFNAVLVFDVPSFLRLRFMQYAGLQNPEECLDYPCMNYPRYELVLQETLWTLAQLFPSDDSTLDIMAFRMPGQPPSPDHGLLRQPMLTKEQPHLKEFRIWGDRLKELKDIFDKRQTATKTFWSLLMDRTKGDQWFHSWVAVVVIGLTLLFGLIQSIEGAIQVYKAYHPDPR
jgi:hypothetical protein